MKVALALATLIPLPLFVSSIVFGAAVPSIKGGFCEVQNFQIQRDGAFVFFDGKGTLSFEGAGQTKRGKYQLKGDQISAHFGDGSAASGQYVWNSQFKKYLILESTGVTYAQCDRKPTVAKKGTHPIARNAGSGEISNAMLKGSYCYTKATEYTSISRNLYLDDQGHVTYSSAVDASSHETESGRSNASLIKEGLPGTYRTSGEHISFQFQDGSTSGAELVWDGSAKQYAIKEGERYYFRCD